jgi:hypothetical protein
VKQASFEGVLRDLPQAPITLEAIGQGDRVIGWDYLWLKYVWGFRPELHCANCLVGCFSKWVKPGMPLRQPRELDERRTFDYVYLCGIPTDGVWSNNLHFPLQNVPGETAEITASTGVLFRARNARLIRIPPLSKGYAGFPWQWTTCRNWRFGVARYGLPPDAKPRSSPEPGPPNDLPAT